MRTPTGPRDGLDGYMLGVMGWEWRADARKNGAGEILASTTQLLGQFPGLDKAHMFRILKRAGVDPDTLHRGARGEKYWPAQRAAIIIESRPRRD